MDDEIRKWWNGLDARTRDEIAFAYLYKTRWSHGTSGHLSYLTITKLAELAGLDALLSEYIQNTNNGVKASGPR